jgi:hypothetical protein
MQSKSRIFFDLWFRDRMIITILIVGVGIWGLYLLRLHGLDRRYGPEERPENFPEILRVLPGATDIHYQSPDLNNSSPGRWSVVYSIHKPYPADDQIEFLTEPLQSINWIKLKYNLLFPSNPNVNRWIDKTANYDGNDYRVWEGNWVTSSDETVWIFLSYYKPSDSSTWNDEFRVNLVYTTSNGPNRNNVLQYRKLHPDEFPDSKGG